ncbi:MAG: hypothetical protein E7447_06800 [Ruminococcaceae bacterium]|nr:hypothetical protein [Oscillospiraceae bacterium]
MRKHLVSCLVVLLVICLLPGCDGYNDVMFEILSNPVNYTEYEAVLGRILYDNGETLQTYLQEDTAIAETTKVVLEVYLPTNEEAGRFYGEESKPCEVYPVYLEINESNHRILLKSGFYEAVSKGVKLSLKTSCLIYMDSNFFYICAIAFDGTQYLNESDGLANIIAMMENNRSLL